MTTADIDTEIATLQRQRDEKLQELFRLDGAIQAFTYMRTKVPVPAASAVPEAAAAAEASRV